LEKHLHPNKMDDAVTIANEAYEENENVQDKLQEVFKPQTIIEDQVTDIYSGEIKVESNSKNNGIENCSIYEALNTL